MHTLQGLSRTTKSSITAIIAVMFCSTATAQVTKVQDGLVGVAPGSPQVEAPGAFGQQCEYDSGSGMLTIKATAIIYASDLTSKDPDDFHSINNGLVTVSVMIDNTGILQPGGTVTINGTTDAGLTDPLMTGDITAIGMEDSSPNSDGSNRGDFRATPTGGSIVNGPDWPGANFDITASFRLSDSTFSVSPPGDAFAADWDCSTDNVQVGAEFFPPPVDTEQEVEIVVNPENSGNCLNINGELTVPVAILGSDAPGEELDVADIVRDSLIFQGLDETICRERDVNDDGVPDLLCEFEDDLDKWMDPVDGEGMLDGQLFNGTLIFGSGGICLVSGSSAVNPALLVLLTLVALFRRRLRIR